MALPLEWSFDPEQGLWSALNRAGVVLRYRYDDTWVRYYLEARLPRTTCCLQCVVPGPRLEEIRIRTRAEQLGDELLRRLRVGGRDPGDGGG